MTLEENIKRMNLPLVGFSEDTPFEKDMDILLTKLDSMELWEQVYNLRMCTKYNNIKNLCKYKGEVMKIWKALFPDGYTPFIRQNSKPSRWKRS